MYIVNLSLENTEWLPQNRVFSVEKISRRGPANILLGEKYVSFLETISYRHGLAFSPTGEPGKVEPLLLWDGDLKIGALMPLIKPDIEAKTNNIIARVKALAGEDDPNICAILAFLYKKLSKEYPSKYEEEEFKWIKKAAESGVAAWQAELGWFYSSGTVVPLDYLTAAIWYKKAADQDQPMALRQLGLLYYLGADGIPRDLEKSIFLIEKAIGLGDTTAINSRRIIQKTLPADKLKAIQDILSQKFQREG